LNISGAPDIRELEKENFDHIIDLQHDRVSTKIDKALKKPVLRVKKSALREFFFVNLKWNLFPKHEHIVHRYLETVAPLDVRNDGNGLDYFIPPSQELKEKDIPASHHFGFVAITFAKSKNAKQLSPAQLQELCQAIDHPVLLMGSKNEFAKAEAIASFDPIKVYNACGKFSLHETADLIRKSKLMIAQDSDLSQVAAAFKKPVIGVWGSTFPLPDAAPYYGSGRPLYDEIRTGNIKKLPVQQVLQLVNSRLAALQPKKAS
jgi:heptosyltransferase-2